MKPTLAILSGGMDSTVLAYHLARSSGTHRLAGCVSVNYGQRHARELACAQRTARDLNVPHYLLDLSGVRQHIGSSSLTGDMPVPHGHYAEANMKATVVPNRNMVLLSLAVAVAIAHKAESVAYGAHAGDHAIYPDCRADFADAMRAAIALCDYTPPTLDAPFIGWTKAQIVAHGVTLGVPFEQTWTCYEGGDVACGKCGTCVERLEAFNLAGATDPLAYQDREFWKGAVASALV